MATRRHAPQRERMSSVDAAWWHMSRPHNPLVVVGVLRLDRSPGLSRLRERLAPLLQAHPRLRRRPVLDADGACWEDVPRFALERHVVERRLGRGADALQAWVALACTQPLPPSRPLWQIVLLESSRSAALGLRIHHCYADGAALIRLLLSLTEADPPPAGLARAPAPESPAQGSDLPRSTGLLDDLAALLNDAERGIAGAEEAAVPESAGPGGELAVLGRRAARIAVALGSEVLRLAEMPDETPTPLRGCPQGAKTVAWCEPLPLAEVKRVAQSCGCSINAVMISCVAGALGSHLRSRGHDPRKTEIRVLVPTPLRGKRRSGAASGNHFGLVNLALPLGIANPVARAWDIHRRLETLTGTRQALLMHLMLGLVSLLPHDLRERAIDALSSKATAVITTVPGPPTARSLAGARIEDLLFWVPQAGDIGLGLSIMSYDGRVRVGLMSDAALLPSPRTVTDAIPAEFARLVPVAEVLAPRVSA